MPLGPLFTAADALMRAVLVVFIVGFAVRLASAVLALL